MEFEWDKRKSEINKRKHGVSFQEAIAIWQGIYVDVPLIAKSADGEARSATLGLIGAKVYTAIWTNRAKKIRLISVKRARYGEEKVFWKKTI